MNKHRGRTYRKRKKLKIFENSKTNDQDDIDFNDIRKWMGKNGYKPTKRLKPKYFLETGRGLMTKDSIKSGDIIVSIPGNLLITTETVVKSELGVYFKKYCPKASGQQILSLFLMFEKAKGKSSEWNLYIKTIPKSYHIPAFYGRTCLDVIPAFIYEQSLKQIQTINNSYEELNLLIKNLEISFPYLHGNLNFEIYKWAWCSVNTRCVFINCFKLDCIGKSCKFHLAMAPFLDLLNHNVQVQIEAGYNTKKKQYEIISHCDFKKYSQVFINYGPHDNWTLFVEYGFILPNNCNDVIPFSRDDILSAYEQCKFTMHSLSEKIMFITENELMRNLICSCDGLSWNLNIILRILASNYNTKWWKTNLQNDAESTTKSQNKFKTLWTKMLQIKLDEFKNNEMKIKNCACKYPTVQLHSLHLLSIANSILTNALCIKQ